MTNTLKDLMYKVQEAEDALDEAKSGRDAFLEPILAVLGAKGGGISECYTTVDMLSINRSGSCRGCPWDDHYSFPLSIFQADDPIAAANAYVGLKAKQKADSERAQKLAELHRLQKELLA